MTRSPTYVSICLPVYNRVHGVGSAIRSVLENEYPFFELIIVDNASTDGTSEVIREYADERIRIHTNKETVPAGENWNIALGLAKHSLTLMVHSDDTLDPQYLSAAIDTYWKHEGKVPIVIGQAHLPIGGGKVRVFPEFENGFRYKAGHDALLTVLGECPHPSVQLIEKKCFETVGYYATGYYAENLAEEIFGRLYTKYDFVFLRAIAIHLGGDDNIEQASQIGLRSWTQTEFISKYAWLKWQHLGAIKLTPIERDGLYRRYVAGACRGIFYSVFRQGYRDVSLEYLRIICLMKPSILLNPKQLLKAILVLVNIKL